eukprot:8896485-Lingulodinium_polyedra.AAC.1
MDDDITLFANGLTAADQFRAIVRTSNESRGLTGLPWQFARAMPAREEGHIDVGAAPAAQALA